MATSDEMLAIAVNLGEAAVNLDRYALANRGKLSARQKLDLKRAATHMRREVDNITFEASNQALEDIKDEIAEVRRVTGELSRAIDKLDKIENLTAATAATFALVAAIATANPADIAKASKDLAEKVGLL